MDRASLTELHFIAHHNNLASIGARGILSFEAVLQLPHTSVAMSEIQDRRAKVKVPGGLDLHRYANLYFHARNPMMFVRKHMHRQLCVLRVDPAVLDLDGVVIADGNASSDWSGFWPSPKGLSKIDEEMTFAEDWTDRDQITYWQKKRAKCAEVLIPKYVERRYITGVYVSCAESETAVRALGLPWPTSIDAHLFFQD